MREANQSDIDAHEQGLPRLHISAFGIHTGGGFVLLKSLLASGTGKIARISLDKRIEGNPEISGEWDSSYVSRSFIARIYDSVKSCWNVGTGDTLLCFNSLPPLRPVRGRVVTYIQAPHLVGLHRGTRYTRLTAIRFIIERAWLRVGVRHSTELWVQTESMRLALKRQNPKAVIHVVPFVDTHLHSKLAALVKSENRNLHDYAQYSFIYPADGVGHKNHTALLAAWEQLATKGVFPRLILSLADAEVQRILARAGLKQLPNVEARGPMPRTMLLDLLSRCDALVFPSLAETFGLPLLEARAAGVPIIASERDFVRDVCIPTQTFDPTSPHSISRAILRFLHADENPQPCYTAAQFIERLLR